MLVLLVMMDRKPIYLLVFVVDTNCFLSRYLDTSEDFWPNLIVVHVDTQTQFGITASNVSWCLKHFTAMKMKQFLVDFLYYDVGALILKFELDRTRFIESYLFTLYFILIQGIVPFQIRVDYLLYVQ